MNVRRRPNVILAVYIPNNSMFIFRGTHLGFPLFPSRFYGFSEVTAV